MTHLIAIDQGTTSTRAIVFDAGLAPVAIAQQELRQIYPVPGWVESSAAKTSSSSSAASRNPSKAPSISSPSAPPNNVLPFVVAGLQTRSFCRGAALLRPLLEFAFVSATIVVAQTSAATFGTDLQRDT